MEDYWVFLNKAKYLSSCWRQTKQVVLLFKCWKYYGHSKTFLYFSYDSFTYFQHYMSSSIICNQYKGKLTEHPLYIFAPKRKIIPELHLFAAFFLYAYSVLLPTWTSIHPVYYSFLLPIDTLFKYFSEYRLFVRAEWRTVYLLQLEITIDSFFW